MTRPMTGGYACGAVRYETRGEVVASTLFGDILSDPGLACTNTIAFAPSANINPMRTAPSTVESVHGVGPRRRRP